MKQTALHCLSLLSFFVISFGCKTSAHLYRYDAPKRIYSGRLPDSTYASVKTFLNISPYFTDSILLRYDYNDKTCWSRLDETDDSHIMGFVERRQARIRKFNTGRKGVAYYNYRQPGTDLNKIKAWDPSIRIHTTGLLYRLLFKERCTCGSSILIMPDRRFVFVRSDSHDELLDFTRMQIEKYLVK